jgi:dTMP kinase
MTEFDGLFITFEGIDGSGKSTQCQMLKTWYESMGRTVHVLREPGGTSISEQIRDILLDKNNKEMNPIAEMLLYFASRNQLVSEKVLPALKRNDVVILDRYVDSTVAYQGYGRGLDLQHIKDVANVAVEGLSPALTIVVDTPLDTATNRQSGKDLDRLEMEVSDFKERVRNGFLKLANEEPDRVFVVDGTLSKSKIFNAIVSIVKQNKLY